MTNLLIYQSTYDLCIHVLREKSAFLLITFDDDIKNLKNLCKGHTLNQNGTLWYKYKKNSHQKIQIGSVRNKIRFFVYYNKLKNFGYKMVWVFYEKKLRRGLLVTHLILYKYKKNPTLDVLNVLEKILYFYTLLYCISIKLGLN